MRVRVRVREQSIVVDVGPGHQRLKWLAMVALQRYSASGVSTLTSHNHVAVGLMDSEGNELGPNKSVRVALQDGEEVFALLQADEEKGQPRAAKGASRFLMMQGAAPNKCIISGPGVTYALVGQAAHFSLQARDTYGNLTSNGGEKFEVRLSQPDSLTAKQLAEPSPDPPATIIDRGDGSYLVSHTMTRKGRYDAPSSSTASPLPARPLRPSPSSRRSRQSSSGCSRASAGRSSPPSRTRPSARTAASWSSSAGARPAATRRTTTRSTPTTSSAPSGSSRRSPARALRRAAAARRASMATASSSTAARSRTRRRRRRTSCGRSTSRTRRGPTAPTAASRPAPSPTAPPPASATRSTCSAALTGRSRPTASTCST